MEEAAEAMAMGGRTGGKINELLEGIRLSIGFFSSSSDSSFPSSKESLPFCNIVGSCMEEGRGGKAGGSSKGPQELVNLVAHASCTDREHLVHL